MSLAEPRFGIGTRYQTRGKEPRICEVTDIYRTYNAAGEMVKVRYQAKHNFMGQTITENDVVETTIAMGIQPDLMQSALITGAS